MRLRRSRTETYYHKKRIVEKDREGSTRESYGTASSVEGESWPASGKVQVQQYGERLNYIRNVRISGKYEVKPDEKGRMHYILENVGTCWTNRAYAPYVEFGTGPKGQADHAGISPEVTPVYTQAPWWIHESQIDRRTAEKYRWFYIDTPQGRFYQCTGQPAHPFLYPALHDNEDKILKNMKASFQTNIGKVSK